MGAIAATGWVVIILAGAYLAWDVLADRWYRRAQ